MTHPAMRILQMNTERGWRGGERQTLLTAIHQRKLGHDVELLAHAQGELAKRAHEQGFVVHLAHSGAGFGAWLAWQGRRYDVLHAQTAKVVAWAVLSKIFHRRPIVFPGAQVSLLVQTNGRHTGNGKMSINWSRSVRPLPPLHVRWVCSRL